LIDLNNQCYMIESAVDYYEKKLNWVFFVLRSGRIHYTEMFSMVRNMEPPVGFGKKCPNRLAYRVCKLSIPLN